MCNAPFPKIQERAYKERLNFSLLSTFYWAVVAVDDREGDVFRVKGNSRGCPRP